MKYVTLIAFLIMSVTMISCGGDDKDKSSSNKGFSVNKLSTVSGYYNLQSQTLELGGQFYPPNQAYASVVNAALADAQRRQIQPRTHNGVPKLRAKVTAQLMNYQQPYNNTYYQQSGVQSGMQAGYNPGMGQGTLNIQQIIFY